MRADTAATAEAEQAQHQLLSADIKRFLERPMAEGVKFIPAPDAPPGAPIGDMPQDWLAPPPGGAWEDVHPTLGWSLRE